MTWQLGLARSSSTSDLATEAGMSTGDRSFVDGLGIYRFDSSSTDSPIGSLVVSPSAGTGRWLLEVDGMAFQTAVNVKLFGAVGDGVADDSAAIQAAHDSLPTSGGTLFFPVGIYLSNTAIAIGKPCILEGASREGSILTRTSNNALLVFTGSGNVSFIRDMSLDGATTEKYVIWGDGIDTLRLDNVSVSRAGTPGYSTGGNQSWDGIRCEGMNTLIATNSEFSSNERDGIFGLGLSYLFVDFCTFSGNGRFGIVNDRYTDGSRGPLMSVITNNKVLSCGGGGIHTESVSPLPGCLLTFSGNLIKDCGTDSWGAPYGIVAGNNTYGTIACNTVENFSLTDTNPSSSAYRNAVTVGGCAGPISITGNVINAVGKSGIVVNSPGYPVSIVNSLVRSAGLNGITIASSSDTTVANCTVQSAQQYGIWLYETSRANVDGCAIIDCSLAGSASYSGIKIEMPSDSVSIGNSAVNGTYHAYGIELSSPTSTNTHILVLNGNDIQDFVTSWSNFSGGSTAGDISAGNFTLAGSAAPSTGNWTAGDRMWNSAPVVGGTIGWYRSTSGTWEPMHYVDFTNNQVSIGGAKTWSGDQTYNGADTQIRFGTASKQSVLFSTAAFGSIAYGMDYVSGTTTARSAAAGRMAIVSDGTVRFYVNTGLVDGSSFTSTERVRISTNGNLLIGSSTDANASYKLQVTGTTSLAGDCQLTVAGNGFRIKEGTDATMGKATLVSGGATVSTAKVTNNSRIIVTSNKDGGTPGWLRVSARTAGVSFTITSSSASDTSDVAWIIIEPS